MLLVDKVNSCILPSTVLWPCLTDDQQTFRVINKNHTKPSKSMPRSLPRPSSLERPDGRSPNSLLQVVRSCCEVGDLPVHLNDVVPPIGTV